MWQPPRGAILVGVDGSAAALGAVRWAARDAALRKAPLALVHVVDAPLPAWFEGLRGSRKRPARGMLESAIDVARDSTDGCGPVRVESKVLRSALIPTLVDMSSGVDTVVVGRRGHGGASARGLLGSVSSALVYHAQCPVAVIHHQDARSGTGARAPVLVGIDGSPASEEATEIAFEQASRRGVGLVALHAWMDPWVSGSKRPFQDGNWDARLSEEEETLAERLAGWHDRYPEVGIHRRIEIGDPARRLLEASELAQLLVVGSHGCGRLRGVTLGSVGAAVAAKAKIPVIVARRP
ncbi:universal stress protein [Mycobacterium parmense]|uniref:Universal stress protein n=1 Tax=Mycobacterium parmense TaxID=185642 RepID=A0A7I7YWA3_9MYCO|nr:universal stress protein [Mycobacterium parmense]MCV7351273.1 universal stress protein [Mycobacterium parmense]ORW60805.1 hypothetical protein AWC20_07645 [Mycobacterium parmense]BBZ45273.1 universal stress protein [Mycobacterium parmense]